MTDAPPYERPVNLMFQSYALFPHMTVFDNVAYGLKKERAAKTEIQARVKEMLALVQARDARRAQARQALRRPAAARGAGPGAGEATQVAAAR